MEKIPEDVKIKYAKKDRKTRMLFWQNETGDSPKLVSE